VPGCVRLQLIHHWRHGVEHLRRITCDASVNIKQPIKVRIDAVLSFQYQEHH
jgi:hypothetical protein